MKRSVDTIFPGLLLVFVLFCSPAFSQSPYIEIVPMSPLLHSELELGSAFFVSSGLQNVGKGEHIYVRAVDRDGGEISDYTWTLLSRPPESGAAIAEAADGIYYFVADEVGKYTVSLQITTDEGSSSVQRIFSGNLYRGVGGVGGTDVSFQSGHCASCHAGRDPDIVDAWRESAHATLFQRAVDGQVPGFGATRQRTATTGNTDQDLESGSYFSLKAATGWEFPATPAAGTFEQLVADHPALAQVATIGCESCHGAASLHAAWDTGEGTMDLTFASQSCQACHDAARPTAQFHSFRRSGHFNAIWSNSFMNRDRSNSLSDCVRCHDGRGYINFTKDRGTNTDEYVYNQDLHTFISCETCHDSHSAELRKAPASSDTLAGGFAFDASILGHGATCADCHKFRGDGLASAIGGPVTVRWGPHYGGATDVILGRGGYEYHSEAPRSSAHLSQDNSCVGCHMSTAPGDQRNLMGDHSWKMRYTDDAEQTHDLVQSCQSCHPGVNSFADIMGADYNMTGVVEPFVDEVQGLLTMLATALPPVGEPTIDWQQIDNNNPDMKGAYWNYLYVRNDRSLGIHNPKYVVAILQRSVTSLTGVEFEHTPDLPNEFALSQNYPNPFNPTTQIQFSLPEQSDVRLDVYDIAGRRVATLLNEYLSTGTYTVTWDARNETGHAVSSGVYIYRIQAGSFVQTKRMVFIK
jgi:hypothetical protein